MGLTLLGRPADAPAKRQSQHEQTHRHSRDRRHQHGQRGLEQSTACDAQAAAIRSTQSGAQQDIDERRDLGRKAHDHDEPEQHQTGISADRRLAQQAKHDQAEPGERAEIHCNREQQLAAADRQQPRQSQQLEVLHVALAPAQVAPDEFGECRRIFLPAALFDRQDAYLEPRPAHQHRLDLIMAQDVPAQWGAAGQHRQLAVRDERGQAQNRVVPPIGSAVALPEGRSERVGPHAEPHAELEDAGKWTRAGQAGHQRLQDADLRVPLHDAHKPQHRLRRHQAVGIEHDGEWMQPAPAHTEFAQITRLESFALLSPSVGDLEGRSEALRQGVRGLHLVRSDLGLAAVAQHVEMKVLRLASGNQSVEHPFEISPDELRVLVANADQQCGRADDRVVTPAEVKVGRDHRCRIAAELHE